MFYLRKKNLMWQFYLFVSQKMFSVFCPVPFSLLFPLQHSSFPEAKTGRCWSQVYAWLAAAPNEYEQKYRKQTVSLYVSANVLQTSKRNDVSFQRREGSLL